VTRRSGSRAGRSPAELFGRNLRKLRQATGISQEELAARAGLHRTYVSSVERGNRNVSLENIFALAGALRCDPRELLAPDPDDEGRGGSSG
jgi:transcriptional regulator with XRE-family HTH domain